jgi:uncharacterized protein
MSGFMEPKEINALQLGILSDTHGHLSRNAREILSSVDIIIHAGDFDTGEVYTQLKEIAPTVAVKGNMDNGPWAMELPPVEMVEIGNRTIYVLHNLHTIDLDPVAAGVHVVICGHTHTPESVKKEGVLYLNPGSAAYPRHGSDPSMAILKLEDRALDVQFISLL